VPVFLAVTVAPATTSLAGFVITPPIEPVVVDCARVIALRASTKRLREKSFTIFDIPGNSLGNELTGKLRLVTTQDATSTMLGLLSQPTNLLNFAIDVPDTNSRSFGYKSDSPPIVKPALISAAFGASCNYLDLIQN
jgi:hypothetical protein